LIAFFQTLGKSLDVKIREQTNEIISDCTAESLKSNVELKEMTVDTADETPKGKDSSLFAPTVTPYESSLDVCE
jgi:hypothetical protein